jgi:hypothetical protein
MKKVVENIHMFFQHLGHLNTFQSLKKSVFALENKVTLKKQTGKKFKKRFRRIVFRRVKERKK